MSASKRAVITSLNSLLNYFPSADGRGLVVCFSSFAVKNPEDNKYGRDDARVAGDGTAGMSEAAKETMKDGMERAKEEAGNMGGAARDTTSSVADMAKEGAVKAMESGLNLGQKAKESADDAWNAAKETTEKVKDAVAEDGGSYEPTEPPRHCNVENLRKRT